jgi:Asp-tRNA(Asn)/Glu-tRNA(Gln) amidotransferase A subunit family amidase
MPLGAQLVGADHKEDYLLGLAGALGEEMDVDRRPPPPAGQRL